MKQILSCQTQRRGFEPTYTEQGVSVALPDISYRWKLAWQDLNLRVLESKSSALPLGDTPLVKLLVKPLSV